MNQLSGIWILSAGALALLFLFLSVKITGRYLGGFIDSRGKMSLSRFQVVMWSWLLISAMAAIAFKFRTMNIVLDEQLWALMGISLGSAAGASIIKSVKGAKRPAETAVHAVRLTERQASAKDQSVEQVPLLATGFMELQPGLSNNVKKGGAGCMPQDERVWVRGVLAVQEPGKASPADMFKGEEIVDYVYVDISKVQMFFFTLAAWLGYLVTLYSAPLQLVDGAVTFPALSTSVVTLIGISHTGYLTVKASTKTRTEP